MMRNNPNALSQARDRMMRRLGAKMEKTVGHRGDLYVADFRRIDPNAGHMLLGYEKSIGPVGSQDVIAFMSNAFKGQLRPEMATAKQYRPEGAVAVVVTRTIPTRKFAERKSMLAISNTHFLDQQLGDTWEVKAQPDGTKYLARVSRDDIGAIVKERRRRMSIQASTVTFGNTLSAGVPNMSVGDVVKFYDSGYLQDGKIVRVGDADVTIAASQGNVTVAHEAVVEILQASPQTKANVRSYLSDYFSSAYGFEEYANELTDRLV